MCSHNLLSDHFRTTEAAKAIRKLRGTVDGSGVFDARKPPTRPDGSPSRCCNIDYE